MYLRTLFTTLIVLIVALGCAGGDTITTPATGDSINLDSVHASISSTHLWGYYDVKIDIINQSVEVAVNRNAMFTINIVNFLNSNPSGLGFIINGTVHGSGYTDVDLDISITHPFSGMPHYRGYDIRGVFMGDGSATLAHNIDLEYPVFGTDQFMFANPVGGNGAPDGYTRWFNFSEFSSVGKPLFSYTQGIAASSGFAGTATLCPYKYFADGLSANEDFFTWLGIHADQHGVTSSGATNTRNYYLRFPSSKGFTFAYAVLANWEGGGDEFHPSNAPEAVACHVVDSSDVYYAGPTSYGGSLKLDISIWDWDSEVVGGVMEDYKIFIESPVLSSVYECNTGDMTPTGGAEKYLTYQLDILADNIQSSDDTEFWVIVEQQGYDYTNDFGVPNDADTDLLTACFRYDLEVSGDEPFDPTLYLYDGTIDDGGMELLSGSGWTYLPTDQIWDENGDPLSYPVEHCGILATPEIDIPGSSTVSALHLRIEHWGRIYRFWDGCIQGYTTDNGATYTWHGPTDPNTDVIFTHYSGTDFITDHELICALDPAWTDCYGPNIDYHNWNDPEMAWSSGIHDTGGWGSPSAPVESDWTCNDLIGVDNVRFVFLFVSCVGPDDPYIYPGFCLRELEVYIEPL